MQLDPSQEHAVETLVRERVCAVVGGPGTGKTTCLRTALDRLDEEGVSYALAAPTGKAATRMSEATGREARTLHRLLEFRPGESGEWGFERNGQAPLEEQLVVVDESSMVDVELAHALLEAIDPRFTRLALVGDADQLPSVGPGRFLRDVVDSGVVPVARLTTLHRAAADSWVCRNAPRVLAGEALELEARPDFRFVEADSVDELAQAVVAHAGDLDQVLVPQRTGRAGVERLNADLQARFNPARPGEPVAFLRRANPQTGLPAVEVRRDDRVIQTSNDYQRWVFNGEIGTVEDLDAKGTALVQYPGRSDVVEYGRDALRSLALAYALTVHKSQGSEWGWVGVVCHSTHAYMLTKPLLYTAITRAKKGVVLFGDRKGLALSSKNAARTHRNSGLIPRLRKLRERMAA